MEDDDEDYEDVFAPPADAGSLSFTFLFRSYAHVPQSHMPLLSLYV